MKTMRVFVLSALMSLVSISVLSAQPQPVSIKGYLTVSFAGRAIENKEFRDASVAENIAKTITSEGIQLLQTEDIGKPDEPCLNIYVSLKDSLKINAVIYQDGGNNAVLTITYPARSYAYNSSADINESLRKYVREYIKRSPEKNGK